MQRFEGQRCLEVEFNGLVLFIVTILVHLFCPALLALTIQKVVNCLR